MTKIDPAQLAAAQAALDEHGTRVECSRFAHLVDVEYFVERLTREQVHYGWHSNGYKVGADRDRREAMKEHGGRTFKVRFNRLARRWEVIQTSRDLRIEPPTKAEVNDICCVSNPDKRGPAHLAAMFTA